MPSGPQASSWQLLSRQTGLAAPARCSLNTWQEKAGLCRAAGQPPNPRVTFWRYLCPQVSDGRTWDSSGGAYLEKHRKQGAFLKTSQNEAPGLAYKRLQRSHLSDEILEGSSFWGHMAHLCLFFLPVSVSTQAHEHAHTHIHTCTPLLWRK